jgi:hypothetical protein
VVVCHKCGQEIRYINAMRGDGIFIVDTDPDHLIGETGRVLTGYREHRCPARLNPAVEKNDGKKESGKTGG